MYIPKHFEIAEFAEVVRFVAQVRSADLVTVNEMGLPISTLLPCMWDTASTAASNYGSLVMHMARANPQWKSVGQGTPGLAIVHGPQAYISPSNYESKSTDHKAVPTWNYQSVHLSGTVEISEDTQMLRQIVSGLTDLHESGRTAPWSADQADAKYFEAQLKGIVAIILHVDKFEAKYKLSQNRSATDRAAVIVDLLNGCHSGDEEIANAMKETFHHIID